MIINASVKGKQFINGKQFNYNMSRIDLLLHS